MLFVGANKRELKIHAEKLIVCKTHTIGGFLAFPCKLSNFLNCLYLTFRQSYGNFGTTILIQRDFQSWVENVRSGAK